jgi:cytochrome c-type biogenesis protein CcmH
LPFTPLFWIVALLLVAAAVAALVWPLLSAKSAPSPAPDDGSTTNIYRDQKRQLDDELAAGAITRAERDRQLDELAARLGAELEATTSPAAPARLSTRASYVTALILVAVIPVSALLLYATFGSPKALQTQPAEQAGMSHEEITAMVEKLATRMKEHPEDPAGWRLLARAYSAMGRYPDSVAAFIEAAKRSPEDAALLADWADALAMQNQSLQGEPSRLITRALALDPNYPKALSLAASAALERKDYDAAIAQWRRLKAQFPPGGEEVKEVDAMIAEAEAASRGAPGAVSANAGPSASPSGGAADGIGTPPRSAAAADGGAIVGRVSLDPKLRERAAAGDAVFIFARAVNGPRMPLAVSRTTAGALPYAFRLDDSMAMTPATPLSSASEVVVEARVSKSGSATPAPGDLRGTSEPVKPGARDVLIVINDVVR